MSKKQRCPHCKSTMLPIQSANGAVFCSKCEGLLSPPTQAPSGKLQQVGFAREKRDFVVQVLVPNGRELYFYGWLRNAMVFDAVNHIPLENRDHPAWMTLTQALKVVRHPRWQQEAEKNWNEAEKRGATAAMTCRSYGLIIQQIATIAEYAEHSRQNGSPELADV